MPKRDTYTRMDVAEELVARYKISRSLACEMVDSALTAVRAALEAGLRVEFRNFGCFELRHRKRRVGRNPLYPERGTIEIAPRMEVVFKPCHEMAAKIKKI